MGTEQNRKAVQLTYEAFGRCEMDVVFDALADDVVWTNYSWEESPIRGVFYGKTGVQHFFGALDSHVDIQKLDVTDIIAAEDKVVVLLDYQSTVKATGKGTAGTLVHVMTVTEGKIATWDGYEDAAENPWI